MLDYLRRYKTYRQPPRYLGDKAMSSEALRECLEVFEDPGSINNPIQENYSRIFGQFGIKYNTDNCVRISALEALNYLTDYKYTKEIMSRFTIPSVNEGHMRGELGNFFAPFKSRLEIGSTSINKNRLDALMRQKSYTLLQYATTGHERLALLGNNKAYLFDANANEQGLRPYLWVEYKNWKNMPSTKNTNDIRILTLKKDNKEVDFLSEEIRVHAYSEGMMK